MHSGCPREAGLFQRCPRSPRSTEVTAQGQGCLCPAGPGSCWGCTQCSGQRGPALVRTGDSSSVRRTEDFDTSAASACRNAALVHFLCCAVRVGSVCGCCTAVQAAAPACLASPIGLWHMVFLSFVYCVLWLHRGVCCACFLTVNVEACAFVF